MGLCWSQQRVSATHLSIPWNISKILYSTNCMYLHATHHTDELPTNATTGWGVGAIKASTKGQSVDGQFTVTHRVIGFSGREKLATDHCKVSILLLCEGIYIYIYSHLIAICNCAGDKATYLRLLSLFLKRKDNFALDRCNISLIFCARGCNILRVCPL